ncbi:L,D-transpeptidase family protein [Citrifermentans pelophilum]|uniref:L,D-transpeptidase family protein n=1 Tax=Geoanaerobacter pelophilus TaxID=60036 RepID=UPI001BDA174E|nr:L,D-transpeptidase family protein [Geoanaerobacter pelophilus]
MSSLTIRMQSILISTFLCVLLVQGATAAEYTLRDNIIGNSHQHVVRGDDSLIELARRFNVGYNEIVAANPGVDPILPEPGTQVNIPSRWIIPDVTVREGIVINLDEMRLYYFPKRLKDRVITYPIGIGDEGWETPIGTYRIIEKIVAPAWHVPASIKMQKPELPDVVPPGNDNPLGTHALRLSIGTILIHGTDRPFGIGRQVSHGCIHLYPEDIPKLFKKVRVGTKVTIIRQPVKIGFANGRVLLEVHGDEVRDLMVEAEKIINQKGVSGLVDQQKLAKALRDKTGIPTDITEDLVAKDVGKVGKRLQ